MGTNINFNKKLGLKGSNSITLPSANTPPFTNLNSFSFDGIDEYFTGVTNYSDLDGQTKATFSLWVKPQLNQYGILFHIPRNTTSAQGQVLCFLDNSYRLRWSMDTTSYYGNSKINVITLNAWNHILICIDLTQGASQNRSRVFINGVNQTAVSNLSTRNQFSTSTGSLLIGEETLGYLTPFLGNMDEFAIWAGQDLRNDVATIYNNGEPTDLNNNGLTAPTTWSRMGDNATWNGFAWTMTDVNGGYTNRSINMVEANRTTDVPTIPFSTKSIQLDGIDDRVIFTQVSRNGVFTFSYWFKFNGTFSVITECFIWGCYNNNSSYIKLVSNTQVILKLNGTQYTITESGGNNITQNTWANFTLIRNASNSVQLYLDGNTFGSPISSTKTFTFSSFGRIINLGFGFKGLIDEASLFYSDETANLSTISSSPTDLTSLSPLSWYRCGDGDTVPTLTDNGSGGNDGTMQNFSTFTTDVPT